MYKSENPQMGKWGDIPKGGLVATLLSMLVIVGFSALTALGIGGMAAISISGAVFAYLLLSKRNIIPWLTLPLSFGVAYLITGDVLSGAAVLLYVPAGVLLAYTVYTKKSLSATVVALTTVLLLSMAAYMTLNVTQMYGESIKESYLAFGSDIESTAREAFSAFRYEGSAEGEIFALSDEDISALLKTATMLLPAVVVVICELMAYGAAKLLFLFLHIFGFDCFYENRAYSVTFSAPAGVVFILSYAVSFFSRSASVAAYSALNLTYILMPLAAISGFHVLFSKNGIFRNPKSRSVRVPVIISCAICALIAPFSFIPFLAMFGSIGAVAVAIREYIKTRKKDEDR